MRTHHGRAADRNWSWEKDAAATAHFARWATLHIRLFPYLYAMAERGATRGDPMFRPLAYDFPDFAPGWTLTDEYLLGDRLLVAPVLTEGATSRPVQLPAGTWYPLLGGAGVEGDVSVDVPVAEIPVFVPAGALLALLPEGVQTLAAAESASDLADAKDDRELWLWPGGTSTLTEVGGLSYVWEATALQAPITSATWNGVDVVVGEVLSVSGAGTLVVNGGQATLVVTGGASDRSLSVRVRGL
jgi:alpha-glucosidase (family GH31 glycosyl hydrolase)